MIHLHIENYYIPYILGWFRSKERVSVRKDLLNHFVYVPFLGSEKEKRHMTICVWHYYFRVVIDDILE